MAREIDIPSVENFSEQLLSTSGEMKELAFTYYEARKKYAQNLNKITVMIYKAGLHKNRAAFENKMLCYWQRKYGLQNSCNPEILLYNLSRQIHFMRDRLIYILAL